MSLKEIKTRIQSVSNTRKTTSAMKMVSSVKLRKAQQSIQYALPYVEQLNHILTSLSSMPQAQSVSPLVVEREVKNVAIICLSSDSSLCGGFNANMIRHTKALIEEWRKIDDEPHIYPIGAKITDALAKEGYKINRAFSGMMQSRDYNKAAELADDLMDLFTNGHLDKVIISGFFKKLMNKGKEEPKPDTDTDPVPEDGLFESDESPSATELISSLLPKVIKTRLYCAVLDSFASEQAARVIAMQAATENADNLIGELTLQYNKLRQQAITNEILDLAGGSQNQ